MDDDFKSFYKTVGGGEGEKCKYPTWLDTYGCGCQHDCSYCYAKSLLAFRGLWNANEPKAADIWDIVNVIKTIPAGSVVRLGGMTDCFQPLEREKRVTLKTIKALNVKRVEYLIVTKSAMVAEKEYLDTLDKSLAHIQITVTTTDDKLYERLGYEKADKPSKRIEAIKRLQAEGFDVAIRLSPYIEEFIEQEKLAGIDKAVVEFLRANHWIKKWFKIDYSKYALTHNGYEHLPLFEKKQQISRIQIPTITVCEDVDNHYKYWRDNFNPNPDDCCNLRRNNG